MRLFVCLLLLPIVACAATPGAAGSADPADSPPGVVDYRCTTDDDCVVKDIGNCCGYYPACVNKDSPTWPEAVKAQCEREGRMAICGFREIHACTCNAGKCEAAASGPLDSVVQ